MSTTLTWVRRISGLSSCTIVRAFPWRKSFSIGLESGWGRGGTWSVTGWTQRSWGGRKLPLNSFAIGPHRGFFSLPRVTHLLLSLQITRQHKGNVHRTEVPLLWGCGERGGGVYGTADLQSVWKRGSSILCLPKEGGLFCKPLQG